MLRKWVLIFGILMAGSSYGQKDTREIIDAAKIEKINIDTDEVYLITIITTNSSEIRISTHSEGEYFNEIFLRTRVGEQQLEIFSEYPERLTGGFDKLSAHKVFSLEIFLEIPIGMEINVNSNIASLKASGDYKAIYANLKQGYCDLKNYTGNAVINTYTGNILVETSSGLIEAKSRNGSVVIPDFIPGRNPIKLNSIDGDIKVIKN
ncbi:hypothetical protein ML462_05375 [Gramella lutea]|uniref:Adhesin domain-containing protein n=1 Tax=Christiangramia lutea TaxID=1607951 RepID=A0A9X2AAJ3_9FLAO|nr:hypothetical protein [Christiangramia lutea]MCH4822597.1 hypothetical protein [Christiangramia lutea]